MLTPRSMRGTCDTWPAFATQHGAVSRQVFGKLIIGRTLEPAPYARTVFPVVIAELAFEVALLAADHVHVNDADDGRQRNQRPENVEPQRERKVEAHHAH